ncbi:TPA: lpg0059 family Dot/Icm T4SS effector, partial [Legionella pneumophila]
DIQETDTVEKTQEKVFTHELSHESALSKDHERKEYYTKLFQPVNKTALRPNDEETDELSWLFRN